MRQPSYLHPSKRAGLVPVRRSLASLASAVEAHLLRGSLFLLGASPTIADFALYGQLSQVIIDRSGDE